MPREWAAVGAAHLDGLEGLADDVVAKPLSRPGIAFEGLMERDFADLVSLVQREGFGEFAQVLGAEGMILPGLPWGSAPLSRHESTMSPRFVEAANGHGRSTRTVLASFR